MNNQRYRLIQTILLTILLTVLLAGSNVMAQSTPSPRVNGNVYGGGNLADVQGNTEVNISAGTVAQNVYGGGKGSATTFKCEKAMVGINEDGLDDSGNPKAGGTSVTISGGTVKGNVYGGGEVGRVERNTQVTIGDDLGTGSPVVEGYVFGAGKGVETHGYSALVRGNSSVTIQGNAEVWKNVYGGGQMSTVGRYYVKGIPGAEDSPSTAPSDLPAEMPYKTKAGGACTVIVKGNAHIGPEDAGDVSGDAGQLFGAGEGIEPHYFYATEGTAHKASWSRRMVDYNPEKHEEGDIGVTWDYFPDDHSYVWEYFTTKDRYLEFLQTLALVTGTDVTVQGKSQVMGCVYGGSKSGFVQDDTNVKIQGGTIGTSGSTTDGNVFGGGKGLSAFAEAGKVKRTTTVAVSAGDVKGNVYGGGELGDVGLITKPADYNYTWKQNDGNKANDNDNNTIAGTNDNTGICTVTISGGTIGASGALSSEHGNVFGAGKGAGDTFWCEKAIAFATNVSVSGGTVNGNVYGGGQIGRVEDDTKVTIAGGTAETTGADVKGSVFAAGAGLATHGYSALVRGNTKLTVEGYANVAKSVYGGGEIASVGRYGLNAQKMPNILVGGGRCELKVQGNATIGEDVFGACMGVTPAYNNEQGNENRSKRMVTYDPERAVNPHVSGNENSFWNFYESDHRFVWEYFTTEEAYLQYLETLALATHPEVTIDGSATVGRSVFGGGELGLTKGTVIVNIQGGTVGEDVYGGGALADTNTTELVADNYPTTTPTLNDDGSIKTKEVYPTTTVNLLGGTINGDAYGGGLGRIGVTKVDGVHFTQEEISAAQEGDPAYGKTTEDWKVAPVAAVSAVEAVVHGNISVNLGRDKVGDEEYADVPATAFHIDYYTGDYSEVVKSGRIFGCNNLNGSPQRDVTVTVWKTVAGNRTRTAYDKRKLKEEDDDYEPHTYEVAAVYGGGNLANYTATGKKANVYIKTCETSIRYVYGGGNAAAVPETNVQVEGAYEIQEVFGGGNGKDDYTLDEGVSWTTNPGADVNGNATTLLTGGLIHEAYGGSNQKGTITGNVNIDVGTEGYACELDLEKMVGAGKNADVNGNLIMILGCKPNVKIPLLYAGADNANVNGNVELTITSGIFGKVFGGNNESGAIRGHIKLNIEETGDCDTPIEIDELYLGGNLAAYSKYGYYIKTTNENGTGLPSETADLDSDGRLQFMPRTSASDSHKPVKTYNRSDNSWTVYTGTTGDEYPDEYAEPVLNVVSCTRIGRVFGGGLGETAIMCANPTVNINMIPGSQASGVPAVMTGLGLTPADNPDKLGIIGDIFGGGNAADVYGNTTVNIGTEATVQLKSVDAMSADQTVKGAYITGNVYGGGNEADVKNNTNVNVCAVNSDDDSTADVVEFTGVTVSGAVKILGSVYGGGNLGSVGTYTYATTANNGMNPGAEVSTGVYTGKPTGFTTGTGTCLVAVMGNAEIGRDNMKMTTSGGPDDWGHVFGASRGTVDPLYDDETGMTNAQKQEEIAAMTTAVLNGKLTHLEMTAYANKTDVTIAGNAFVKGSVYGGSENGHVLNDTHVTINGTCQIGNGWDKTLNSGAGGGVNQRYTDKYASDVWTNRTTYPTLPECASWTYGQAAAAADKYAPYDPFALSTGYYDAKSTKSAAGGRPVGDDGHTFYGNVFGGGSGYYPYAPGKWLGSAGAVYGDTYVTIKGGHILTNVYGGNEMTDVGTYDDNDRLKLISGGNCYVTMIGGTLGVPRTLTEIDNHPVTCYLFGAGKGDQRVFFNKSTNVGNVYVHISDDARIFGSVFGGGEDGHVMKNVTMNIGGDNSKLQTAVASILTGVTLSGSKTVSGVDYPYIGTWGTSYVEGNVFGGGRGFGGDAYTAGNVAGKVTLNIAGGTMLGSIYGGGRLGSVGYGLFDAETSGSPTPGYGEMRPDNNSEEYDGDFITSGVSDFKRGHVDITISGGTIGNDLEYIVPNTNSSTGNTPSTITETDISKWTTTAGGDWDKWKEHNNVPKTEFDTTTGRLTHTKGGNVFAGGMGRQKTLNGEDISVINWWRLGCVKQTKLTITGGHIKSNVYGGGELGAVIPAATNTSQGGDTEISISGTATIGTDVKKGSNVEYTFGSVYGGGMGSEDKATSEDLIGGRVEGSTKITMSAGKVKASVYGGGELAVVKGGHTAKDLADNNITNSNNTAIPFGTEISISGTAEVGYNQDGFGGATMGNVYGGGKGSLTLANAGLIKKNTLIKISGGTIYHNIYGGGAYGSVGTFTYGSAIVADTPSECANLTGKAEVIIEGGIFGINGQDNGMIFGSSRGDVAMPVGTPATDPNNKLAWVDNTHVVIGKSGETGPTIKGSVYGSGENGHVLHDTFVEIHSGTIGIETDEAIGGLSGANYPSRGNVYGGGCGTDTYSITTDTDDGAVTKTYFNRSAGIVRGNSNITMDGGHVVRSIYGGGAMGSVGTFTRNNDAIDDHVPGTIASCVDNTGLCTVTISGGEVGPDDMQMPMNAGMVFGAGRGEVHDPTDYPNLERVVYTNKTEVTISGTALVKGSVYGGSESGHVLSDTKVTIEGGQIGCGKGKDVAYTDAEWEAEDPATLVPVPSWAYVENGYAYDMYASTEKGKWDKYPSGASTEGGRREATDGHTFYGNVFGGGSGYIPYAAGQWLETAGRVEGNTVVEIKGGHILSNVYGGNECTDVLGTCRVDMTGGTVGVPYPATDFNPALGHLFGAGKGDKRIFFNTWTNVKQTTVNVSGGRVFGSVYGGGEDGHVGFENDTTDGDATTTISGTAHIGTNGNSGYDGNVFGGGQGSSTALTAGVVQRKVTLYIQNGQIDGSVYGGGRIASVGTHLVDVTVTDSEGTKDNPIYGTLVNDDSHGDIKVYLTGGTINQDAFGGCMGSRAEVSFPNSKTQDDMGVSRDVELHLNDGVADTGVKGCVVKRHIFGCNNQNSSPRGHVLVHIYKTQNENATQIANADASGTEGQEGYTAAVNDAKVEGHYDVSAVYGGGNLARYMAVVTRPRHRPQRSQSTARLRLRNSLAVEMVRTVSWLMVLRCLIRVPTWAIWNTQTMMKMHRHRRIETPILAMARVWQGRISIVVTFTLSMAVPTRRVTYGRWLM